MLPWFEPVLFPRSKTHQVRPTLHAIHYWREFAKLKEKKHKNMKYSWLQYKSIKTGISHIKKSLKTAVFVGDNFLGVKSFPECEGNKNSNQSVWKRDNKNFSGHLFGFSWLLRFVVGWKFSLQFLNMLECLTSFQRDINWPQDHLFGRIWSARS